MAYNRATKVKLDRSGNYESTVWCYEKQYKTGTIYYGGTYTDPKGQKIYFKVSPKVQDIKDRQGNVRSGIPVTITRFKKSADTTNVSMFG